MKHIMLERFVKSLEREDEIALETTGNSCFFPDQVSSYVSRVVVIAPWQFELIRRSGKKTDKHDAHAIAFFLSKNMLPESRLKKTEYTQLASLIQTRDQLVRLHVSLLNKVHGLFNRRRIKIKKETLTTQKGFEKSVKAYPWDSLEQIEIDVITEQLEFLRNSLKKLEKEIANFAKTGNLATYLGIVPRLSQSNDQHLVGRITKRGCKIARKTLVQCTLIAEQYSPYLQVSMDTLKPEEVVKRLFIATARKFLNTIFYTLKNNWVFEDFTKFKLPSGQLS